MGRGTRKWINERVWYNFKDRTCGFGSCGHYTAVREGFLYFLRQNMRSEDMWSLHSKIEKVPRGIQGEGWSKHMASSRNLVSTIGAQASPKNGDGTKCPEG